MPATKKREVNDVFFSAASESALKSFAKHGKVAVNMSALVSVAGVLELMPIHLASEDLDARMIDDSLEEALTPLVTYITKTPKARVEIFFMSARAGGTVMDKVTKETEEVDSIINAARTEAAIGRTDVFKIKKEGGQFRFEQLDSGYEKDAVWLSEPEPFDLCGTVTQTILQSVWIHYISLRNLSKCYV